LPDLIGTGCEEAAKVESLAHSDDNLGQDGLGTNSLLLFSRLLIGHGSEALLICDGDGDDRVASSVLFDPLRDLGQVLVLLADVVLLTEVDEEDDGLGREKEERVDDLDLVNCELVFADLYEVVKQSSWGKKSEMDVTSESPGVTRTSESWD
jgi:hypothetical protein